jgi:hypothetical protein
MLAANIAAMGYILIMLLPGWQTYLFVAVMSTLFRSPAKTLVAVHGIPVPEGPVEPVPALAVTRDGSQGHT